MRNRRRRQHGLQSHECSHRPVQCFQLASNAHQWTRSAFSRSLLLQCEMRFTNIIKINYKIVTSTCIIRHAILEERKGLRAQF